MCGIVAIVTGPDGRPASSPEEILAALDGAIGVPLGPHAGAEAVLAVAGHAAAADERLRGIPGVRALLARPDLRAAVTARLDVLDGRVAAIEARLESEAAQPADLEALNAALVTVRDALWAIRRDRLRTAGAVLDLGGRDAGPAAVAAYTAVQMALSAIDRLEVRGRDSAGLHLLVWDHQLDPEDETVRALLGPRSADPLFRSGSVRLTSDGALSFVYKAAAEIGELGDNTAALRAAIRGDDLLRLALAAPAARVTVLGHTRWASVGIISEPNAHPLNQEEDGAGSTDVPYVVAGLNGDVDNHADLKAAYGLRVAAPITTDAKVIPALVSRAVGDGFDLAEAFRRTVASFEGSVAIGACASTRPDSVLLALRGSGQALYVGLADGMYIVASEPYGLVEETAAYVRMDGETPARPGEAASRGQVFVLDGVRAGTLEGIRRLAYDGTEIPLDSSEIVHAEITTRDIDRGAAPHFLLKEIVEAPTSFRKTLRGHIHDDGGLLRADLGDATMPAELRAKLASGAITRVVVIGQGTAAVAGQSVAEVLAGLVHGSGVVVQATTATELSGFGMAADLSDTLVVAVSQSGTTTDTNRTVDLARGRGASVVAIVNRRRSDLTDKSDGVLYTSDGRDVEMSVASTKAFYAQVAAGVLLSCAVAEALGAGDPRARHVLLAALRELPDAMRAVLDRRPVIAEAARRFAPPRRHWAVVGNGPNRVAAEEVRIKLSELCYKSIACDVTEDKKHIDLSSEPLILVCAAGLVGSTADDVAKEVAIYRAHKAAPIVIASEGEERFNAALDVITVPAVEPRLAFVLSAVVGHLFGYEAALAIDALARPLREAREAIESAAQGDATGEMVLARLREALAPVAHQFVDTLRSGMYDGNLEASTAVRLSSLLRYAAGPVPLDAYQLEHGKVGTPEVLIDDLTAALTRAIEELTRPIDAIKHQAKTVTVGISRSDEGLLATSLVQAVVAAGAGRDRLEYRALKQLAALAPAVEAVVGYTRYRIDGDPRRRATIEIVDRAGLGREVPSRVERNHDLRGTKRRVAMDRDVLVARGRADGRTVVLVPEIKGAQVTGITLLHVRIPDHLPMATMRGVLQGYRGRYDALADFVTETEPTFRDDLLETIDPVDLLTDPIADLADRWRT
jgi:glucosamine--fructose-6-phosphate aminotransferase (isomerizing)